MYDSSNEYEVSVLVNGRSIPEVHHNGRTYIEGRKNSRYSLRIHNNTSHRVLAIPAVDGLSVLDGQPAGINSPGFVLEAYATIEVPGWKVSGTQEAGRFIFKPQGARYEEDETYVESMDLNPTNQGTIGFMFFREKERLFYGAPGCPHPWDNAHWANPWQPKGFNENVTADDLLNGNTTRAYNSSNSYGTSTTVGSCVHDGQASMGGLESEEDNGLGTGWGEAVDFHTKGVSFEKANPSHPDVTFIYYYDTIRNLRRLGVPVEQFYGRRSSPHEANPFPASPHVTGGCKPPPGWRGGRRRKKQ